MILLLLSLSLTACAGQTPLQMISDDIGQLTTSSLSDKLVADAQNALTLPDSDAWKDVSATNKIAAKVCPNYIIAAQTEKAAIVAAAQALLLEADDDITSLSDSDPRLVTKLVEARYGPSKSKVDQAKDIKSRAIKLVSGYRSACLPLVIDDEKFIWIAKKVFGVGWF
jgi:hypothetical protein